MLVLPFFSCDTLDKLQRLKLKFAHVCDGHSFAVKTECDTAFSIMLFIKNLTNVSYCSLVVPK